MRTVEDAQRSLQRYLAEAFPDWEVRPWADEGSFELPAIFVRLNGSTSITGGAWLHTVEQPMRVYAYPVPEDNVSASNLVGLRLQETLHDLFAQGGWQSGGSLAAPLRLPLWDWDGMALDDSSDPPRGDRDYMRIALPLTLNQQNDPQDQRLVIVTADLRISWGRSFRSTTDETLVQSVRLNQTATLA